MYGTMPGKITHSHMGKYFPYIPNTLRTKTMGDLWSSPGAYRGGAMGNLSYTGTARLMDPLRGRDTAVPTGHAKLGVYFTRTPQPVTRVANPRVKVLRGLGQMSQDPSVVNYDPTVVDPVQYFDPTIPNVVEITTTPVADQTVSSGNPISDFFAALTGAARTATAIYSAADLIRINGQRANQGLPPLNAYGQVGPAYATGPTLLGGISPTLLMLGAGLVLVFALKR
jgi:hypothetical protein